eukprot:861334-Prymnesium_polylepis.1
MFRSRPVWLGKRRSHAPGQPDAASSTNAVCHRGSSPTAQVEPVARTGGSRAAQYESSTRTGIRAVQLLGEISARRFVAPPSPPRSRSMGECLRGG